MPWSVLTENEADNESSGELTEAHPGDSGGRTILQRPGQLTRLTGENTQTRG